MWRMLALLSVIGLFALRLSAQTNDPTADAQGTILVFPFEIPSDSTGRWIGRGAAEDLITDLTQATRARIKSPNEPFPARDAAAALNQARQLEANIVIFGQAQVVDLNVRLTGQVLDVATEKTIGAIKVTGPLSELFQLEDTLAREVFAALPQNLLKPEVLQFLQDTNGPQQTMGAPVDPNLMVPVPPDFSVGPGPIAYEPANPPYAASMPPYAPLPVSSLGWNVPYDYGLNGFYGVGGFYPGWSTPPGTIVIINNGAGGHHRDSHHQEGGHGRWDHGNGQQGDHSAPNQAPNGSSNPVPVQFTWGGGAASGGIAGGRAPVQMAPRGNGFSGNGFSRGGFSTMSGPRFGGSGFHSISGFGAGLGNTGRGGTVGR